MGMFKADGNSTCNFLCNMSSIQFPLFERRKKGERSLKLKLKPISVTLPIKQNTVFFNQRVNLSKNEIRLWF